MNNCLQQFFTVYHYICDTFKIFKLNSIIPILKLPLPFHNIICLPKRYCFLSYTHVYFCAEQKKIYFLSGSIICELAQSTFSFQILFFFWIGRMERMGGGSIVTLSRNLGPAYYFVIYLHLPLIHKYIMINLTYTFLHPYDRIFFSTNWLYPCFPETCYTVYTIQ